MIRQKRFTREIQKSKYESVIIFPIYSREYQNIFIRRPRDPPQVYNNPQQVNLVNTRVRMIHHFWHGEYTIRNRRPNLRIHGIHRVNIAWEASLWITSSGGEAKFHPREKFGKIYIHRSDSHNAIAKRWRHSKKLHLAARSRATTRGPRDKYSLVTRRPFNPATRAARFLISINSNSIGLSGRPNRVQSAGRRRETG